MLNSVLSASLCFAPLWRKEPEVGKGSYFGMSGVDFLLEWNGFFFRADHALDLQTVRKLQPGNSFKALLQVRLHSERVLGL